MAARLRRWATTLAVALAVAATVVGAGYGLQRAVLRPPLRSEMIAAQIEGILLRYRYVTSEIHVAGVPPVRAQCLEGWEQGEDGRPAGRGGKVAFADGERLVVGDRRIARTAPSRHPSGLPPVAEIELAGCPRALTTHIYGRLVGGKRVHAISTWFRGERVLALRVHTRRSRFALLVHPRTYVPVGMLVRSRGVTGWSVLRPVPLTPALKHGFLERFDG